MKSIKHRSNCKSKDCFPKQCFDSIQPNHTKHANNTHLQRSMLSIADLCTQHCPQHTMMDQMLASSTNPSTTLPSHKTTVIDDKEYHLDCSDCSDLAKTRIGRIPSCRIYHAATMLIKFGVGANTVPDVPPLSKTLSSTTDASIQFKENEALSYFMHEFLVLTETLWELGVKLGWDLHIHDQRIQNIMDMFRKHRDYSYNINQMEIFAIKERRTEKDFEQKVPILVNGLSLAYVMHWRLGSINTNSSGASAGGSNKLLQQSKKLVAAFDKFVHIISRSSEACSLLLKDPVKQEVAREAWEELLEQCAVEKEFYTMQHHPDNTILLTCLKTIEKVLEMIRNPESFFQDPSKLSSVFEPGVYAAENKNLLQISFMPLQQVQSSVPSTQSCRPSWNQVDTMVQKWLITPDLIYRLECNRATLKTLIEKKSVIALPKPPSPDVKLFVPLDIFNINLMSMLTCGGVGDIWNSYIIATLHYEVGFCDAVCFVFVMLFGFGKCFDWMIG